MCGTQLQRSRVGLCAGQSLPLPAPPASECDNVEALEIIHDHSDLFAITIPINVDRFKSLLSSHPNPPFVWSVCRGLCEGFWPFSNTHYGEWPLTWDNCQCTPKTPDEAAFLQEQIDKEVELGHYSVLFILDLFPGVYSMPVHAVPKPGSKKFHHVTDHSAGQVALNNMISHENIAGVTLDNVQDLGNAIRYLRQQEPDLDLILWKADVSEAYRHMPMHPLWQIKQNVSFHSKRYVDQCNVFRGRAFQHIWHAFMSLVTWIAVIKYLIYLLYLYVNNSFSAQKREERLFYKHYPKELPSNLTRLLQLWDFIGLPHEERK